MGHELHLAADIRAASAEVRFGRTENKCGDASEVLTFLPAGPFSFPVVLSRACSL
jgi:enoyl-CoA hydratase/carnithine racemase